MYDPATAAVLFFLLVPGVLVTLPPGASPLVSGLVHALVFWIVFNYLSLYVPWWGIWIAGAVVLGGKLYMGRSVAPPTMY